MIYRWCLQKLTSITNFKTLQGQSTMHVSGWLKWGLHAIKMI